MIHGSNDAIVPFYHGQTLFQTLPDSSKTVPFWARGAGHNNIEMDMPTAYIKRLQQFIRQCNRLNYPDQMSARKQAQQQQQQHTMMLQQSLQNSLRQSLHHLPNNAHHQQQGMIGKQATAMAIGGGARGPAMMTRYASQDSYHPHLGVGNSSDNNKPGNKQRKQKGTLVMRSLHNHGTQAHQNPPPPPPRSPSSPQLMLKHRKNRMGGYQKQQQKQQHQPVFASNSNNAVQYHRSMSTSVLPSNHLSSQLTPSSQHCNEYQFPSQQSQQVYAHSRIAVQRNRE
jgi:hypothetical protein